jgi:hypothetical protein
VLKPPWGKYERNQHHYLEAWEGKKGAAMVALSNRFNTVHCPVCYNLVPKPDLHEHLKADFRLLDIIKTTHPEWGRHQCEDYLRSISATGPPKRSDRPLSRSKIG